MTKLNNTKRIKTVRFYRNPRYPKIEEVEKNRTLLAYQPSGWKGQKYLMLTLSALLAGNLGACEKITERKYYGQLMGDVAYFPNISQMSDTEALKIIEEELQKAGYQLVFGGDQAEFSFDAYLVDDEKRQTNLEFVSAFDCENRKYPDLILNPKQYNNPELVAAVLKDNYQDTAVFYAPDDWDEEALLRQQVVDYLTWLQTVTLE